ncbi:ATP-binding protein [Roseibium aggregatum]|uniref:histidine kinase n=1 Tax=Roseibium aggregatum TaxID=187304 RepID=A0A926NYR1_9HYPH|nr:ATP-binding protein [Roseibium aggregatum]MBD1546183.1 PAS domain S-box protein [Roseibium aggregatum]
MDNQLQTFVELSTLPALAELAGDARAAWVWSADGSRILWANAAGASFFSVRGIGGFSRLSGLARSPARPHIARIATSGDTERMSIDRLRFYRGLRVLLLTCQCQRLVLPDGHDAALIVCGDKGLALTEPPFPAFLDLLAGNDRSAFLIEPDGAVGARCGDLAGAPETAPLEGSETVRFAPVQMEDGYHDAAVFRLDPSRTLALVENEVLEDMPVEEAEASEQAAPLPEEAATDTGADEAQEPTGNRDLWVRAQDVLEDETDDNDGEEDGDYAGEAVAEAAEVVPAEPAAEPVTEPPAAPEPAAVATNDDGFQFVARRRPVRFAWQMDIDQRVTFISDEFAETMGPAAADIVGRTWAEIAESFGIDRNGKIARALDRRDTWSCKTVNWPVSGAALRVPVDMAALPAFNRDRAFEGYRGFGVCRSADVIEDPDGPLLPASLPVADALPEAPAVEAEAPLPSVAESIEPEAETPEVEAPEVEVPEIETPEAEAEIPSAVEPETPEEEPAAEAEEPSEEPAEEIEAVVPQAAKPDAFSGENSLGSSVAAIVEGLTPRAEETQAEETQAETPEAEEPEAATVQDNEEAPQDEDAVEAEGEETAEEVEGAPAQVAEEESPAEPVEAASEEVVPNYKWDETPSEPATDSEPQGISGPAPLKPAEIETAVKTLAKSYDQKRKQMSDVSRFAIEDETPSLEPEPTATADEEPAEPVAEPSENVGVDLTGDIEARTEADEEREFFDETAAFKEVELDLGLEEEKPAKEKGTSAQLTLVTGDGPAKETPGPAAPSAPVPDGDDKVVRLTGRSKPRLVPVDTSRLSKPEREAFRKIAEALGARLEGDFDEEGPAEEAEALETAAGPTAERQAGPIHPRLLDRLPIGIAIASDREVLYANDTLLDLLGYPNLAALGEAGGLEAVFADHTEDNLPDAEGMDGVVDGMLKVRLAGGGSRAVDARMHSVPWNGGRGLMISITERPKSPAAPAPVAVPEEPTQELQKAQALIAEMDTILETATDGVLVIDAHGTITKANRSAEALFGASRTDIEGAPLTDYLAPESHRAALDYLDGLARNGVASILNDGREVLGRVSSGGLIPLFMTIGRITSGNGDAKFCAVLRDITHWKKAEEELTEAKRQAENASSQKSDFLAKISHEIRTPLNAIIGFSEVMMEERFGAIGNDRYKEYLKDIRTSGSHIMSLINDLLDLSKIEAGKLDLRFSAVSANDVINECVALMQPQANRERVIIRASLPDSVPSVVADPRSMRQIVLNLLSNAIKFNKSGGQVIVSTALEDSGEVYLRVRDTGTGMSAKDLAAALEPFRQVHTARHGGGTGLGLPLTKALVEANRASFHIDSTPGQGTLVEISFPSQRVLAE